MMFLEKDEMYSNSTRDENIVWTISKDYDIAPLTELVEKTGIESLDRYRMAILGMIYRLPDHLRILAYCVKKKIATQKQPIFSELMILTMEEMISSRLGDEYAGFADMQRKVLTDVAVFYDKMRKRGDVSHEIRYTYYAYIKGSVPKTNARTIKLLDDILLFEGLDPIRYTTNLDKLLQKHFHFQKSAEIELTDPKMEDPIEKKKDKDLNKAQHIHLDRLELDEQVTSAEFSQVDIGKMIELMKEDQAESPMDLMPADEKRIYRRIIENYGPPTVTGQKLAELEKRLSVGIHLGEHIHITDRFMQIEGYKKQMLFDQMQENIDHFDYMNRIYRRNITRLVERLTRAIVADTDHSPNRLDNGMIMPERIWRRKILGDSKVFYKNFRDTRGEFAVDILLDASGSQIERQSLVAAQGYIIAEALTQVGISCRVSSFNNLFDYMILKIYRDYRDGRSKNRQIFSYQAEGSNRDGMALAVVGDHLITREEEHKILIVLSDGKPNDERVGGIFNTFSSGTKAYVGEFAVKDTAHQVRLLRAKGIAVLGVFTGLDEDLAAEQRIFGKDFAYISKIERFSDVVGTYLKRQISNILDS